jgi:hypothetical protein
MTRFEDDLRSLDRELASQKPPEIVDNKVFIYPVKQP